MKPRLLQHVAIPPLLATEFNTRYDAHPLWKEADPAAFLARHGHEFTGYVTSARFGVDDATLAAMPNLKVISSFGVGTETLPLEAAQARGIAVGYTPDVLNDCVADTAFGLVMDVARRFSASDRFVRARRWLQGAYPLATRVSGKQLGILGLGRIGQVVARRASGFDMEVRYHNRRPNPAVPYTYESSIESLARWADFLVVVSAGGPETRHLVTASVLRALGPQGFLINVSRGSVIDEDALIQALEEGTIAGAGLDVYADEPRIPERLLALDQVVLLPHLASATNETRQAMAELVVDNLDAFYATGKLRASVPLPA
ncbi:2-hydroxyacid dehydrogenase [Polaromonas sp. JS666]|uniref:2-hydroxyacid dehydrogenase n=1 Tax=Polaromonas sp. (strain JS666 / ATCC BAA-500) TaxID=296591 RepID=UPI00004641B3|nr:2-hydroxyacid dehydrogenase [Polaromonas sp. JS666]ABE44214.1 D-isomer specific 2-hydroxyacid dehydrogenase, NAD-binding protein [Polaromonas sp. JS666]